MRLSKRGIEALIEEEALKNRAYTDQEGNWTIGVGHLLTQRELETKKVKINDTYVPWAQGLSNIQIMDLLEDDLREFETAVTRGVTVPLSQNQFDALVIFAFNVGAANFLGSTLLRKLNEGDYGSVPTQLRRWNKITVKDEKVVSKGLVNRREAEVAIWKHEGFYV